VTKNKKEKKEITAMIGRKKNYCRLEGGKLRKEKKEGKKKKGKTEPTEMRSWEGPNQGLNTEGGRPFLEQKLED